MSPLLAVSALEKAKEVPSQFWLKVVVFLAVVIAAVIVVRLVSRVNKFILFLVAAIAFFIVGFNWIYQRNEPAFMSPMVDAVAPFFPSKGAYDTKQQEDPGKPGLKKSPASAPAQPSKTGGQPTKK